MDTYMYMCNFANSGTSKKNFKKLKKVPSRASCFCNFCKPLSTPFMFHLACVEHIAQRPQYIHIYIYAYMYIYIYYIPYVYMFIYICVHKRRKAAVEKQLELKFFAVYIRIYIYILYIVFKYIYIYICIHTHSSTLHTNVDKDLLLLESGGT